jgi:hypothetical protein
MTDPVIVQTLHPVDFSVEEAERLVAALEDEGLEARRYKVGADHLVEGQEGYGPFEPYELVLIWLALRTGEAVVNQVVDIVVEWMREQFRREPDGKRPKRAFIVLYEGDEGQTSEVLELEAADAEPVRRPPQEDQGVYFEERRTRSKPPKL